MAPSMAWLHWKNCEYLIRLLTGSAFPRLLIAVIAEVLMISGRRKDKRGVTVGIGRTLLGFMACMQQWSGSDLNSEKFLIYLSNLHKETHLALTIKYGIVCCWLPLTLSGHL